MKADEAVGGSVSRRRSLQLLERGPEAWDLALVQLVSSLSGCELSKDTAEVNPPGAPRNSQCSLDSCSLGGGASKGELLE